MDRFTRGIAMTSARHPWRTIAGWVLVMGTVFFLAASGGGTFADDFTKIVKRRSLGLSARWKPLLRS